MEVTGLIGPSVPERARTVLARATSAHVLWPDRHRGPGWATYVARLEVVDGEGSAGRRVAVEIADAAGLPVRERILSRLRITGRATPGPEDATVLRLVPSAVSIEETGVVTPVDLAAFLTAQPDPWACDEAAL